MPLPCIRPHPHRQRCRSLPPRRSPSTSPRMASNVLPCWAVDTLARYILDSNFFFSLSLYGCRRCSSAGACSLLSLLAFIAIPPGAEWWRGGYFQDQNLFKAEVSYAGSCSCSFSECYFFLKNFISKCVRMSCVAATPRASFVSWESHVVFLSCCCCLCVPCLGDVGAAWVQAWRASGCHQSNEEGRYFIAWRSRKVQGQCYEN